MIKLQGMRQLILRQFSIVWDVTGANYFRSILVSTYYKRSKGVMLVYDITQKDTFVAVETWLNEAKQGCHADVMVPIILGKYKDSPNFFLLN